MKMSGNTARELAELVRVAREMERGEEDATVGILLATLAGVCATWGEAGEGKKWGRMAERIREFSDELEAM
jgi:hypothetical protein